MDYEVAFAMASQPSQISMPMANFSGFHHWNDKLLAGPGLNLPFSAASTTNYNVTKDLETSPFSIFGGSMQSGSSASANPQPSGPDLIDSDEDFGDFESVPAEDFRAPSLVGFSTAQVTNFSSQPQESYDIFDFYQPSSNAQSGSTHASIASADLLAHFAVSSKDPSIAGASGAVSVKIPESNSEDDWGDFVEHSTSANQENLQSFDWFHATPRPVEVALPAIVVTPRTNGANSGWIYEQSPNLTANPPAEVLPGAFNHFAAFSNVTEAGGLSVGSESGERLDAQVLLAESEEFRVDAFGYFGGPDNFFGAGNKVLNPELSGKSDAQGLNNSTDAITIQRHETALPSGQIMSQSTKASVQGNISTPIPLSLFGEEELENEASREELADPNTRPFQGHSSSKALRSGSSPSGTENFSDFIASLYARSQAESPATDAHTWNTGSPDTENEVHIIEDTTIKDLGGDKIDESGLLNNGSINILQSSNGSEGSSLEEQLFDLKLCLRRQRNFKYDHRVVDGNVCESCEAVTISKENSLHFGAEIHQSPHKTVGETQVDQFAGDTEPLHNLDYNKVLMLLIGEGRIHEALACRAHASALDHLSSLQEAYTVAVKASEQEKAASIEREIEEAKLKFAPMEEIWQWGKRSNHMVSKALSMTSSSNGAVADGIFSVKSASSQASLCYTMEEMVQKLGKSCSDRRAVVFEAEFQPDKLLSLAKSDMAAAVDLHSQAVATFWVLASTSVEDQHSFVKAWAAVLTVCASELEHALNVWRQAQHEDIHLALLANVQGERYFAAVGQIYAVSQILAAASILYKPWLSVIVNEGKHIHASLERCKAAWVGTGLKEAVRLGLCGSGNLVQNAVLSWHDLDRFATIAHGAALQAANFDATHKVSQNVCGFCLLPLLSFSCLPSVEWAGRHYLLPLANIWANCVSHEAPKLPLIELGNIVIP